MLGNYDLAAAKSGSSFNPSTLILILIVVVAFYFLMIRPQQRRKQAAAQQSNNVEPGARVRTTAGMYATVVDVDGDDVILEVAPGVEVRYMKRAIMEVVSPGEPVDETETDEDAETDADHDADSGVDTDAEHTDADWESFASDDVAETGSTTSSTTGTTPKG
ncbi:MAG TPA: preprotein translocase subunit YajC [Trebonia sp.]|nr:preprotein translocase subunit YajC [Trebonia sp.]